MQKRDEERVYCEVLRKDGKSYSEIRDICEEKFNYKPSKGMLSRWLKNILLTKEQKEEMNKRSTHRNYKAACNGAETNKRKKQERIEKIKNNIDYKFDMNDLKTAGLMLYWGEGTKYSDHSVSISNSDPYTHRLFIKWLEKCYGVEKTRLSFNLHIHKGLDVDETIEFWCKELGVNKSQFIKPYVKDKENTNHRKNKLYKGTLQTRLHNTELWHKINFEIEQIKKVFLWLDI